MCSSHLVSWLALVCKVKDNQLFPFLDILEDIREECQKYGPVVSLLIPKENPGKGQVSEWREEVVWSCIHSMCCRAAAQCLKISCLMAVLKISDCFEGQHRFLPGYVRLPNLGGAQSALAWMDGMKGRSQCGGEELLRVQTISMLSPTLPKGGVGGEISV